VRASCLGDGDSGVRWSSPNQESSWVVLSSFLLLYTDSRRLPTADRGSRVSRLTELPFNLPGRIFRSQMPWSGIYDPEGDAYCEFKQSNISLVVLLAEEDECLEKAGRNLADLYRDDGLDVIHLPIPDYGVPRLEDLAAAVAATTEEASKGRNIVIHCSGGIGRTGTFLACLARYVLRLSGEEAVSWVRQYVPRAVETPEQYQLVKRFNR